MSYNILMACIFAFGTNRNNTNKHNKPPIIMSLGKDSTRSTPPHLQTSTCDSGSQGGKGGKPRSSWDIFPWCSTFKKGGVVMSLEFFR